MIQLLLRTLSAYTCIHPSSEPIGLKFYVEEILHFLHTFLIRYPTDLDMFLDMGGPTVILELCSKLSWQDSDLAMGIVYQLLMAGEPVYQHIPSAPLAQALSYILSGFIHYERLRQESA